MISKALRLNYPSFADDVLLFSYDDFKSVYYLLQGMKLFSESSGLFVNPEKTTMFCASMEKRDIDKLVTLSGFKYSRWPFMYLGVPISPKKINKGGRESTHRKDVCKDKSMEYQTFIVCRKSCFGKLGINDY